MEKKRGTDSHSFRQMAKAATEWSIVCLVLAEVEEEKKKKGVSAEPLHNAGHSGDRCQADSLLCMMLGAF